MQKKKKKVKIFGYLDTIRIRIRTFGYPKFGYPKFRIRIRIVKITIRNFRISENSGIRNPDTRL